MLRISSRQNPIVGRFRAATRGATDAILLDGAHLVGDALAAGVRIDVAAVGGKAETENANLIRRLAAAGTDVVTVTSSVLDALSPVRASTGLVALARRPPGGIDGVCAGPNPLVVVVVGVQDPGNVGAIIRVAEAAGATGAITTAGSADPFGWKALRGSMGSSLRLPLAHCDRLPDAIATVRRRGCRIAVTVPRGGRPMFEASFQGSLAILVGGEGAGLPDEAVAAADERVTIPMAPPVESLNAAVAAAVILYEARRQRKESTSIR